MLRSRVITALVLGVVLAWILFFQGALAWNLFLLAAGALAADEWAALGAAGRPLRLGFALATVAIAAMLLEAPDFARIAQPTLLYAALAFWCVSVPLLLWRGLKVPAGVTFYLVGWLVILPTVLALARLRAASVAVLLTSMAVIWVSDISAYFAGRAFGRHRLAPSISPGKTWEGVAGALIGVLVFGALAPALAGSDPALAALRNGSGAAWWPLLLVMAALGIEGDLFESWLKRCAGVKDSGWILPGHGGVLDRIDALTAALPVAVLMFDRLAAGGAS